MSYNPDDHLHQKKRGITAIWIGLILVIVGLARIFVLPDSPSAIDDKDSGISSLSGSHAPKPEHIVSQESPVIQEDNQVIQEAQHFEEISLDTSQDSGSDKKIEKAEAKQQITDTSSEIQPQVQTYFAQVREISGEVREISLVAVDEEKARKIIKDFRGNPEILHGPALKVSW